MSYLIPDTDLSVTPSGDIVITHNLSVDGSITAAGGITTTTTTAGFLPPRLTTAQMNALVVNGGIITEYPILTPNSQPAGICAGPDGNVWFGEYVAGQIGKITPIATGLEIFNITTNQLEFYNGTDMVQFPYQLATMTIQEVV